MSRGYAGCIMVNDKEQEMCEMRLNSGRDCYIDFHKNSLGERRDSPLSPQNCWLSTRTDRILDSIREGKLRNQNRM